MRSFIINFAVPLIIIAMCVSAFVYHDAKHLKKKRQYEQDLQTAIDSAYKRGWHDATSEFFYGSDTIVLDTSLNKYFR